MQNSESLTGFQAQSFSRKGIKGASRFLEGSLQTPVSPSHQCPSMASYHFFLSGEEPMNLFPIRQT